MVMISGSVVLYTRGADEVFKRCCVIATLYRKQNRRWTEERDRNRHLQAFPVEIEDGTPGYTDKARYVCQLEDPNTWDVEGTYKYLITIHGEEDPDPDSAVDDSYLGDIETNEFKVQPRRR